MRRRDLLRYLMRKGCAVLREGAKHTVMMHAATKRTSTVPRHSEVNDFLARKICRDLGVLEFRR